MDPGFGHGGARPHLRSSTPNFLRSNFNEIELQHDFFSVLQKDFCPWGQGSLRGVQARIPNTATGKYFARVRVLHCAKNLVP